MCLNFIAIPSLSETPEILAIYSIVISLSFFFRYADFGLVAGGKKYAAENVTSKNIFLQLKFLGNSFSVTFLISTLISIVLIFLSLNPEILISSLKTEKQFSNVASDLIRILSIVCLLQVIINFVLCLFEINLKKYYCNSVSSVLALVSIGIFFIVDKDKIDWIVIYFLSIKLLDLVYLFVLIFLTKKVFGLSSIELFRNFKPSKDLLKKTYKLSLTTLITSFLAMIFYEMDSIFLAKTTNLKKISFYSIAALGPFFIKSIFSVLFSPFNSIFNYFRNNENKYRSYFEKVVIFFFPLTFAGIIAISLYSEQIIFSYVGICYSDSIKPFIMLCLAWSFSFLIYPTGIYLFSMEFNRRVIFCSMIPPLLFWSSNFYDLYINDYLSIEKFCFNKMLANLSILPIYIFYLIKDKFINFLLLKKLFKSLIFSLTILFLTFHPLNVFLNNKKDNFGLILNLILVGTLIILIKILDLKVIKNQISIKNIFSKK